MDGQQTSSRVPPQRIPLLTAPNNRGETTTLDSKLVNAYVEKLPNGEMFVVKRPGLVTTTTATAGTGTGIYNWLGNIYQIVDATMYKDGVALAGTLDTTGGVYTFSATLGGTPSLFFQNGVQSYAYNSGTGIVATAAPPTFSGSMVKGSAYLDGTIYIMDTGANIWGSGINDLTTWDALNLIKAQIESDGGVAIAKQLVYVVAFKQWSTEIFYDAGNATGSPLGPVQGAKISYGCRSADSVQDMDGVLFWVTATRAGSVGVMKMEELETTVISTQPVERLLQSADFTQVYSWVARLDGHKFYGVTLKNSNLTLVYDNSTGEWSQWTDPSGAYLSIVASTYSTSYLPVLQDESDGHVYKLSHTTYNDDGVLFPVDVYTPNYDAETKKGKVMSKLYVLADQTAGSKVQIRTSDDDYISWSNPVTVDLSLEHPYIDNMGTFSRRAHHVRHICNTPLRLKALEAHMLMCVL